MHNVKKYLFLIPILFILISPKNVFARINRIRTFNSDYSTTLTDLSVPEGTTFATYTGWTNSTAFIRLNMTDSFEPNKTYSASFGFCIYVLDKDFQIEFGNLIGGWNVGGGYVSGTPVESTLVDYSHLTNASGRSQYMRCYTQRWQFTTPGVTTYPFFQIGLNTRYQTLNKFSWWNWTIEKVDSDMSDVTNSITNNTNQIIINNNNNTDKIIESQQETTEAINDLNDTISNNTIDNNIGSGILSYFSHNDHPISGLLTAPFQFLYTLDDQCQPLTLPVSVGGGNNCGGLPVCVNNITTKNISLQCGDTLFWNRSDVSTFRIFWNTLFGGAIIYVLGVRLFKTICRALDPFVDDINSI